MIRATGWLVSESESKCESENVSESGSGSELKVKVKVKGLSSLKKEARRVFDESNRLVGWLFVWLVLLTKY